VTKSTVISVDPTEESAEKGLIAIDVTLHIPLLEISNWTPSQSMRIVFFERLSTVSNP
jgi:hypothetical protein